MSISMKRYNDTIITPKDDRILFDQIFDDYGLIYGGSATMAASNKIHVGAARGFIKGTEVIVEAEDIAVNLSDSGTKNGRLKIVMDLADTETPIKFESEVAASFPALEQDANINYDNGRYEVVFATYKATETTISSVALVMPTMQSVKAKIQGINQSLNSLPIELSYLYSTSESGSEKKQLVKSISEFKEIMLVARKHESNFYSAPSIRVPRDKCVQNTILRTQDFDGNWIQVNFIDDTHIMWSFDNSAKPQFQILGELYGI